MAEQMVDTEGGMTELVARSNLQFTLDMYRKMSATSGGDNIFFSPFSISTVLAMTQLGSRGNTLQQMRNVMHLSAIPSDNELAKAYSSILSTLQFKDKNVTLNTANRMYVQNAFSILDEFKQKIVDHFKSDVSSVNFQSDAEQTRNDINNWVLEMTNNKIKDLLPEGVLDALTRVVLINAVYFKGDWLKQFKQSSTNPQPFQLNSNRQVTVQMMKMKSKFYYAENKKYDCKVLEMPYVGDRLSMFIVLPNQIEGLVDLESKLSVEAMETLASYMDETTVQVQFPKFKLEESYSMNDLLISLGMEDLFSIDRADLSGITGDNSLYVSSVVHKAFVEVNEQGSEAAAATGAVMNLRSMPAYSNARFVADRPFIFFIRDQTTGLVLFMGSLRQPEGAENKGEL